MYETRQLDCVKPFNITFWEEPFIFFSSPVQPSILIISHHDNNLLDFGKNKQELLCNKICISKLKQQFYHHDYFITKIWLISK